MRISDFFMGKALLSTPRKNSAKLVNICMRQGIAYRAPRFDEKSFFIECDLRAASMLTDVCCDRGIELITVKRGGLPVVAEKYRYRYGIIMGAIAAVFLLVLSFNTVWRIELKGNNLLSFGEVETLLAENGFFVGSYIPGADLTLIENKIMNSSQDVAWMSINIDGTVAKVEIREKKQPKPDSVKSADLVATRDGKIERIEAFDGNCVVKVGDVVKKGDLLVSGTYYGEEGAERYTVAKGNIYARTLRHFSVEVPMKFSQKSYTERKKRDIYINFFKKSIKIFSNSGKMYPSCDIICKNRVLGLFGGKSLPIGYSVTEYLEYEMTETEISENEAMEKAFSLLEEELSSLSKEIELLRKNIEFEIKDGVYVLNCELVCVENVAEVRK